MISDRIAPADLLVEPKREIRQRTDVEGPPKAGGKQRVVVEMERTPQAAAKCDDNGEEERERLPKSNPKNDTPIVARSAAQSVTPPKLVPRPKNAAERAARLRKIFDLLDAMYPDVRVPLVHRNAWELLVATILSAQCTDKRVNEVTPELFRIYPTMTDFANANQAELAQNIRSTGFFNNKAKSLIGAAKKILADYGGHVPKTMQELLTVPGAARKTANVVLGGAFGITEGIVVDTHVQRLAGRLDLSKQSDPVKIEQDLMKIVPRERWFTFPLQLIYHGRTLCFARNPNCGECKLDPVCYAKDKRLSL